jgi:hypothetical protein
MASARELLEQADALMRKNRSRGDADIPLLTDAVAIAPVASPLLAPALIAVEKRAAGPSSGGRPAVASPDLASNGKVTGAVLAPEVPSAAAPTEPVSAAAVVTAGMTTAEAATAEAPPEETSTAEVSTVQVPVLTDVVENFQTDAGLMTDESRPRRGNMEGDPSDWLVMDTVDPATLSSTGGAPDTLAVVPPMTLKAAGSAATPPPVGSQSREQQPAEQLASRVLTASQPPAEESVSAPTARYPEDSFPTTVQSPPDNLAAAARSLVENIAAGAARSPRKSAPAATAQVQEDSVIGTSPQSPIESVPVANVHSRENSAPTQAVRLPVGHAPGETARSAGASVPSKTEQDRELWPALAEQISMQVLQRLDLFIDTGLKAQLAQRLEPIVERASAELVGEITEQVGRLVRTYVSEAIEREIAQWRRDQH